MNFSELSLKELKKLSINEAVKINKLYDIDLLIYVAKAGFPIAYYMNEVFGTTLIGIGAQRKGNMVKEYIGFIVSFFPRFVRDFIVSCELKSRIHKKSTDRHVQFHASITDINKDTVKTILIVDDSVDTGYSMLQCYQKVKESFPDRKILTYSLNVWSQSKTRFLVDYCSYEDTVIRAPMSKDSKEYRKFCAMYDQFTDDERI